MKKTIKELNEKIDKLEKDIINKDNKIKELEGKNKKIEKKEGGIDEGKEENNENDKAKEIYDNLIKEKKRIKFNKSEIENEYRRNQSCIECILF